MVLLCGCPDGGGDILMPAAGKVTCGTATCDIATGEHCCAAAGCSKQACAQGTLTFECDGPEDCGAQACCLNLADPDVEPGRCSTLKTKADQCANGPNLCHADGDCPSGSPRCCFGKIPGVPADIGTCMPNCT
jgi:hypothetical protein